MKLKQLILALAFMLATHTLFAQGGIEKQQVIFKGTTDTIYNGSTVVLYNKITKDHDSAVVAHGKFEFVVPYKEPTRYMFYSKFELKARGGYAPFGVLINKPGIIYLKADLKEFTNTLVADAPENVLYQEFIKTSQPIMQQVQDDISKKFGPDYRQHLVKNDPQYEAILDYYNKLNTVANQQQVERLGVFIEQHPDSFAALYLLSNMITVVPYEKALAYYQTLGKAYKETSYGLNIRNAIDSKNVTAIGKPAPDFEQPDTSGKLIRLSDFKGQYVLLDFWASWCIPCREENPNVVKAYQRFHNKGFTVVSVSLDQPGKKEAWLNAIHHDQLTWTQVSDLKFWNNAVAKLYGIQAIPQNFLLDKDGKIIAVNIKGAELTKKLLELFPN